MAPAGPAERSLAAFSLETQWSDLPEVTRTRVEQLWIDGLACALAGRRASTVTTVERLARQLAGPGSSFVVGGPTMAETGAVLTNGYQVTSYTMCDVHRPLLCHVTPVVLPPVLAVTHDRQATGEQALTALAVGIEVALRVGHALDDDDYRRRRWHAPGVIGPLGGAVAAARLMGLTSEELLAAMGVAASQSSGTFAALGTPAVKFHQARGAVSALWAARFAAEGLGGSSTAITAGDGGLLASHAGGGMPERLTDRLGERWHVDDVSLRRWPAASSLQSLVECMLSLHETGTQLADVDRLEILLPPASYHLCADRPWDGELIAMQSAAYVASTVLQAGRCWLEQYSKTSRTDAVVGGFASSRVLVREASELPNGGVVVVAHRRDGDRVRLERGVPIGAPGRPLDRDSLRSKFTDAVASWDQDTDPMALWNEVSSIADATDASASLAGLRQAAPTG